MSLTRPRPSLATGEPVRSGADRKASVAFPGDQKAELDISTLQIGGHSNPRRIACSQQAF
ncbi:hypothetical protein AGR7A_pAt20146 [Agrobacterium deltaense NCPPB 1641]|uniref:Uncharacterized protein n=1 Tax=Agrobacterium deltaense NCPPB 1641 TaxID=1183425 RepID=A0A1S7U8U4_9HYPH|nr:hypothetical protein AGR7A_pAt20146 [Agrobacterium deltaense NCPPB 1641]